MVAKYYKKGTRKGTRKGSRKGTGDKNKVRKHSTRRRSVGGMVIEKGKFGPTNVIDAAKRGDQGVPIANPFGSNTLIATELPTMPL